ncbi:MAG: hypothetical protein ACNI3A_12640 [Desulfovibrio sp.]|uniref:MotE family protein n=1 Tax=Desulfovibrio sp. 7SRBS1 TaxID=3378064 RepID=UPI003B425953
MGAIGFDLFGRLGLDEVPGAKTVATTIAEVVPQPAPAMAASNNATAQNATAPNATAQKPANMAPADWQALKRKQEELSRKEQALHNLERELNRKIEKLTALEKSIKAMLDDARSVQDKKFKHLVDVYSNMKAKNAAQALEKLDQKTAVKILSGMRGRKAGEVLNFVTPANAAKLSQELTRMQIPFE